MTSGMNAEGGGAALPLGDRYRAIHQLGEGRFGPTYLAEDMAEDANTNANAEEANAEEANAESVNRTHERCVVKPFVPPIEDKTLLEQARSLFEQNAGVLYELGHKQLPEFRRLLQVEDANGGRLFFVRDYVDGSTYQQLLQARQRSGGRFNETEITQLLYDLLPVLSYLHTMGIAHGDISPSNIVLRHADGLPVLVDLGYIKAMTAAVRERLSLEGSGSISTQIGKVGYIPQEQLDTGRAEATSDLYALAASLLVLATGQDPQQLYNSAQGIWKGFDLLSPRLGAILEKMLAVHPAQRFQTTDEVLAALQGDQESQMTAGSFTEADAGAVNGAALYETGASDASSNEPQVSVVYDDDVIVPMTTVGAHAVRPEEVSSTYMTHGKDDHEPPSDDEIRDQDASRQAILPLLILLGVLATLLGLAWLRSALSSPRNSGGSPAALTSGGATIQGPYSPEEAARRQEIRNRQTAIGLGENTFERLVDRLFYDQYPSLETSGPNGGRKALTSAPEDEPLRIRWENTALSLLDALEGNFSQRSVERIGEYSESDRARWESQVNDVDVSERSLYDLTDTKFSTLFPDQVGRDFSQRPTGQLYYAIADDTAQEIASGSLRENVQFAEGAYSQLLDDRLGAGGGQVYTLQLTAGQLLRLNLNASGESTLISIYPPPSGTEERPAIIADSEQKTWSGEVTQTGIYEVVVVNQSTAAIDYQLTLSVDNVSSSPPVAPEEEDLPPVSDNEPPVSDGEESPTDSAEDGTSRSESGSETTGSGNGSETGGENADSGDSDSTRAE